LEGAPLRIALLSYRSLPTCGGQGVYVRQVSRELTALGHQVTVLSGPPYPILDDGVELERLPSLDLFAEPTPFRWPSPRELRGVAELVEFGMMRTGQFSEPLAFSIRAYQALRPVRGNPPPYDIVHDNQTLGYGMVALRRALAPHGIPVVATLHHPITVDRRLHLAATTGLKARIGVRRWYSFLPMQARVARRMDGIVIPSESSRADIIADMGLASEQMHTVPLGTDADRFSPDPSVAKVTGRIVVVTSADVPLKGLRILLEALAKIRVERPDAHVVCVGKVREGGIAARQVAELGLADAVTFHSNIAESTLIGLLRSAQVAVVPSLYEGFSLPAVEEMACGLPLVATTAGALPEVVGPDGEAGLAVPPRDAGAMAAAITRLLDDPELRARLGASGRRRVEERFSWRAATAATAAWYADRIAAVHGSAGTTEASVARISTRLVPAGAAARGGGAATETPTVTGSASGGQC
jgi:glycosyltransferase involved in cell wall biosynthesis